MKPKNEGYIVPTVIEKTKNGERAYDIYSRLLEDRIILGTPIDDGVAGVVVAQLLFLQMVDPEKEINLYIQSPGGSIVAGLAIYDTMQIIKPIVNTYCIGQAASMGAILLAGGSKGHRFALENSRIMIHAPSTGVEGTLPDIEIQVKETQFLKDRLYKILSKHTDQTIKKIEHDCLRDNFMSPEEAKSYHLIDEVVYSIK